MLKQVSILNSRKGNTTIEVLPRTTLFDLRQNTNGLIGELDYFLSVNEQRINHNEEKFHTIEDYNGTRYKINIQKIDKEIQEQIDVTISRNTTKKFYEEESLDDLRRKYSGLIKPGECFLSPDRSPITINDETKYKIRDYKYHNYIIEIKCQEEEEEKKEEVKADTLLDDNLNQVIPKSLNEKGPIIFSFDIKDKGLSLQKIIEKYGIKFANSAEPYKDIPRIINELEAKVGLESIKTFELKLEACKIGNDKEFKNYCSSMNKSLKKVKNMEKLVLHFTCSWRSLDRLRAINQILENIKVEELELQIGTKKDGGDMMNLHDQESLWKGEGDRDFRAAGAEWTWLSGLFLGFIFIGAGFAETTGPMQANSHISSSNLNTEQEEPH